MDYIKRVRGHDIETLPQAADTSLNIIMTDDPHAIACLYEDRPRGFVGLRVLPGTRRDIVTHLHVHLWVAWRNGAGFESASIITQHADEVEVRDVLRGMFKR